MLTAFVTFDPTSHLFCRAFCKDSSVEGAHLRVWRIGKLVMGSREEATVEKQNKNLSAFFGGKIFPYKNGDREEFAGNSRPHLSIKAVWSVIA